MIRVGLDVGSTTLKCVVLDENNKILYSNYQRHFSQIAEKVHDMLQEIHKMVEDTTEVAVSLSGSAGMGFAMQMGIPFVQEVYATRLAVKTLLPDIDTVIELGGEDAKILFVSGTMEVRMNGSCAGGTGAFIDQMATLLGITPLEMNEYAKESTKMYTIASRCGVFAKSDIQPLLNQGARKEDIAASIFAAVVNQTIAGLAQGREIKGNVLYLGGPLTFFPELRHCFDNTLKITGIYPENSLYYVAMGTALAKDNQIFDLENLIDQMAHYQSTGEYSCCEALFEDKADYDEFAKRHHVGEPIQLAPLVGNAYIGIDAGSTTLKAVLIGEDEEIVHYKYMQNGGTPVPLVKDFLLEVYEKYPDIKIAGVATTGYGEEIIKNAFHADLGIVETMAHFTGAKKYNPEVDFIIDIGGQDIKCFKIRNGAIDNIFLNEACSSGCGSFLQTFAAALGEQIEEFSKDGLFAHKPVDLGSRCTVFMNSSVKQAQKDGAGLENISAGLSISVVKNALYKVIRIANADQLGQHIVVQGGTFLNNAVLRAFEKEIGRDVTRPRIAGLMGAYGAALYCKANKKGTESSILTKEALEVFTHDVKAVTCQACQNHCKLTVNTFEGGRKFIGGNRCEKPLQLREVKEKYNLYDVKKAMLEQYGSFKGNRETIGIPMGLNMFEMLPFWHAFFKSLGFGLLITKESTRDIYIKGQHTIPSDTVCYPAKLIHGHIEELMESKVDAIFYPCMTYNFDEGNSDNHYNCPVVAYYPEVIKSNNTALDSVKYIGDYIGVHRKKDFPYKMYEILSKYFDKLAVKDVVKASKMAYKEYEVFMADIRAKGKEYLRIARSNNLPVIVLAGRPYHLDAEINHGIDKLICDCGAVLVTEDAVNDLTGKVHTNVLNQWTYHARLYAAADYIASRDDQRVNLVQLVSFGCGIDAITTDEVRKKLEDKKKIYTLIKIDEITNLGAVKIRLRSLFAAIEQEN
ncbi:MAG: acyl-CoA dehydratase activase [Eubacteriales bacterium]